MTNLVHPRVPAFAIAVVAAVSAAGFAASFARAGGLQAAEQFVQPFLKTFSGSSTGPIVVTHNKSTGPSLQGTSDKGNGIVGQTKLNNGGFTGATAIVGQDLGTTGAQSNAGVGGTSVEGTGVFGTSTSGSGIFGSSNSSVGADGISLSSYGVAGTSTSGTGVSGSGVTGVSGSGSSESMIAYGQGGGLYRGVSSAFVDVFDVGDDGSVSATGMITGGTASASNFGMEGIGLVYGVLGSATNTPEGGAGVGAQSTGGNIFVGYNSSSQVYAVDQNGNVIISGQIYTSGPCATGCAKTGNGTGRHIASFMAAESEPTTEDFGESQLRDGFARVQIAADFANTIDKSAAYMVFLSPEGDTRGLFVTDKSPSAFTVHENQGGHATVSFSYRIVAKRYGMAQQRLPVINVSAAPHFSARDSHGPTTLGRRVPRPATIPRPITRL